MDIREALYTTRAMRRVKPDPIPMDVQARIMDAAVRAPSGGNVGGVREGDVRQDLFCGRVGDGQRLVRGGGDPAPSDEVL